MRTLLSGIAVGLWVGAVVGCSRDEPALADSTQPHVPGLKQAAYDHFIRLQVRGVTPVAEVDGVKILELRVRRWHGKISQDSLERSRAHETQELTILFPAAPDATIKVDDILDYRLARYVSLTGD